MIQTPEGSTFRRNRRHVLKSREDSFPEQNITLQEDFQTATGEPEDASLAMPALVASPVKETETPELITAVPVKASRFGRLIKPPKRYSQ